MEILTLDQLPQGGFAGLKEKQVVTDYRVFGARKRPETANGIGNFVYLADANFLPHGETGMHPHHEIDVISVMAKGRVSHGGSLEHGKGLVAGEAQVQRAGGEGFAHNEVNPDDEPNQLIQLWVLPETKGEPAGYKAYTPEINVRTRIYGGSKNQTETFDSQTVIEMVKATEGYQTTHNDEVLAYLSSGEARINGETIQAGTLVRTTELDFVAHKDSQLILIFTESF
ncbi:pirin family protein [Vibrio coralliilyticus]|uniref:pirin family protein n=1 Tax=Vibrio coralliilyticus TaxID=190893 RepID=UPI001560C14D|nr:pirin family protein [Vibrio coralliilyticus]NRF62122.1 pirin family protein [Vibrio coralliilyticus]